MLTVHHLNQSRSKRLLWLLEELQMTYKRIDYRRDAKTHMAPESLKEMHPLGKAPVRIDGDVVLCESSAVMKYIINQDEQHRFRPTHGSTEYYQ
jgi:glutathione S-transferase